MGCLSKRIQTLIPLPSGTSGRRFKKLQKQAMDASSSSSSSACGSPSASRSSLSKSSSSRASMSSSSWSAMSSSSSSSRKGVPKGYLPIRVREQLYMVKAEHLNDPLLADLLFKAAEEYGYSQAGVLQVVCDAETFEHTLRLLSASYGRSLSCRRVDFA